MDNLCDGVVKAVAEEARSNDNSGAVLVSFMLLLGLLEEDDTIRREIVSSISSLSAVLQVKAFVKSFCGGCEELKGSDFETDVLEIQPGDYHSIYVGRIIVIIISHAVKYWKELLPLTLKCQHK